MWKLKKFDISTASGNDVSIIALTKRDHFDELESALSQLLSSDQPKEAKKSQKENLDQPKEAKKSQKENLDQPKEAKNSQKEQTIIDVFNQISSAVSKLQAHTFTKACRLNPEAYISGFTFLPKPLLEPTPLKADNVNQYHLELEKHFTCSCGKNHVIREDLD